MEWNGTEETHGHDQTSILFAGYSNRPSSKAAAGKLRAMNAER
jgi:hypothetical protein